MDKVEFIKVTNSEGLEVEHAIIDRGNNEFTSMTKEQYDKLQAEQSTPIVIDEAEAK
jgi:predicted aspartyl protease